MRTALTKTNIQAGFRATGIWPLNPSVVDHRCSLAIQFNFQMDEAINLDDMREAVKYIESYIGYWREYNWALPCN